MPEQIPIENQPVIGEDGELVQPDTSVDPEAYTEYLATHVHRDPLLFRMREHIQAWGCAYFLIVPISWFGIVIGRDIKDAVVIIVFVALFAGAVYLVLQADPRH